MQKKLKAEPAAADIFLLLWCWSCPPAQSIRHRVGQTHFTPLHSHSQAQITPGAITPGHLTPWNVLWRYNTPEKDIGISFANMLERSALINESALMTPMHISPSSPALESRERCNLPRRWSPFRTINIDPSAPRWLRHRGDEAPASMLNTGVEESGGPSLNRRLPLGPPPPRICCPGAPRAPHLGRKSLSSPAPCNQGQPHTACSSPQKNPKNFSRAQPPTNKYPCTSGGSLLVLSAILEIGASSR